MQATLEKKKTDTNSRRAEFIKGLKDTLPLMIGAAPFGMIFGVLGVNNGLSPAAVMGFSIFVFAGSSQFIAAQLVAENLHIALIVLTTFIVNLRHALYSASLGPAMKDLPQKWMLPLAFWLTDETYAIVIRRWTDVNDTSPLKRWYHLGSAISMYLNWQLWTLIGLIAGTQLQGLGDLGLEFAMVVTFIGIVVPMVKSRPMLLCAIVAGVVAVLGYNIPNKGGLMLAAFAGIAAGVIAEAYSGKEKRYESN
jgi:4-azaleucine resistance transporter AzlC